jgi:hypothetical protein
MSVIFPVWLLMMILVPGGKTSMARIPEGNWEEWKGWSDARLGRFLHAAREDYKREPDGATYLQIKAIEEELKWRRGEIER